MEDIQAAARELPQVGCGEQFPELTWQEPPESPLPEQLFSPPSHDFWHGLHEDFSQLFVEL
jgi:hypothetical protein